MLEHLRRGEGISSMEAFELYGATRLSAIIFELRRKGFGIEAVTQTTKDRYGRRIGYARYYLRSEPQVPGQMTIFGEGE